MMIEDDACLMRASLHDPELFAAIFDRHHVAIWRYVARLAGTHAADEIAGEVFTAAFARRATFDSDLGEVRPWLFGIAGNLVRMRARGEARAMRALQRVASRSDSPADEAQDIVDFATVREATERVVVAMGELDHDDRQLIVLFAWEELSYGQIAEAMAVPIGTVRSRLSRARQRLRDHVAAAPDVSAARPLTFLPTRSETQ